MNEGHSALITLALLEEQKTTEGLGRLNQSHTEAVRSLCVFTTHTPVPAGHDRFPGSLVRQVLGPKFLEELEQSDSILDGTLNMTSLALHFSRFINGVLMRHEHVSREMFPNFPISSITNGVHAATWTHPFLQKLYDRFFPD